MTAIPLTLADLASDIMLNTIPTWLRKIEDVTLRRSWLFNTLLQKGRIVKRESGPELIWLADVRLPEVRPFSNHQGLTYAPTQKSIQFRVGWRALETTESMSMMDQWINSGENAIRKIVNDKANSLRNAMRQSMYKDVYLSGESSGRTDRYHGIDTMTGAGTCTSTDKVAAPSDTYAGQSTVLATNGGYWSADLATPNNASISTDWPDGQGDPEYDCNSPILVNTSCSNWGTSSTDHGTNLFRAISQAQVWLNTLGGDDSAVDLVPMDAYSFQRFRENQEAKSRYTLPVRSATDVGLPGSDGSVNMDGMTLYPDFWCPQRRVFMLKSDKISLHSITPGDIFMSKGPIELPQLSFASIWALFCAGNFKWTTAKGIAKLYPIA